MSDEPKPNLPKPNPGSFEAIAMGCLCPIVDNLRGQTPAWGHDWWIDDRCPLHGDGRDPVPA